MISKDDGNRSREIFEDLYKQIKDSGLLQKLHEIRVTTVGNAKSVKTDFSKYEKTFHSGHTNDLQSFEFPTLLKISNDSMQFDDDTKILYLHLKGASKSMMQSDEQWKKKMLDCVVHNHEVCLEKLKTYDAVGTLLSDAIKVDGKIARHYSGNFWWTTAKHIKKLPWPDYKVLLKTHGFLVQGRQNKNPAAPVRCNWRYLAEFWIGLNNLNEQHSFCNL